MSYCFNWKSIGGRSLCFESSLLTTVLSCIFGVSLFILLLCRLGSYWLNLFFELIWRNLKIIVQIKIPTLRRAFPEFRSCEIVLLYLFLIFVVFLLALYFEPQAQSWSSQVGLFSKVNLIDQSFILIIKIDLKHKHVLKSHSEKNLGEVTPWSCHLQIWLLVGPWGENLELLRD